MTKHYVHQNRGTCSRQVEFDLIDGKVCNVQFTGGCSGNTQGVAALVEGMSADDAIRRMFGIRCGFRPTSCPDQLAEAIRAALEQDK